MEMMNQAEAPLFVFTGHFDLPEECSKAFLPLERLMEKELRHMKAAQYLRAPENFEIWFYFGDCWIALGGARGPNKLATGRNPPRIIISLNFSDDDYVGKTKEQVRLMFADGVQSCFELLVGRALKRKAVLDEGELRTDFASVMQRFLNEPIPPYVPLGKEQIL